MRILFINNDGSGFADYLEVEPNTTVDKLFTQQMPNRRAERQPPAGGAGPRPAGGRPREYDADQDPRGASRLTDRVRKP